MGVPSEPFQVRSERSPGMHRLTPIGELDMATAPVLGDAIRAGCADDATAVLVIDLRRTTFIDSTGLRELVNADAEVPNRLRIVNGSPQVERLFDLVGLRGRLPIIKPTDDPLAPLERP